MLGNGGDEDGMNNHAAPAAGARSDRILALVLIDCGERTAIILVVVLGCGVERKNDF